MKEINLEEFKKTYMGKNSKWNFDMFRILCNKCDSDVVEFNGFAKSEGGYYGDHDLIGYIVVKCHACGNAFRIDLDYANEVELNTDGENAKRFHRDIKMTLCHLCGDCEIINGICMNKCGRCK